MEYNKKIDGYNITKNPSKDERLKDIEITYFSKGEKFADSITYKEVEEDKIKKVDEKLFDYTLHNLNCETVAEAISLFTIISEVERVIYEC